ncbi:MAG: thiamine pyrophosphate-binding protein [Candidatus Shapirobacteria bacterium]|nr:thiamine pyrophosphate-binding protein [Candidatus Shapirobacteria bacterium]
MIKLSEYVVKFLEKNKVGDIFMLSGGGCMHLVDSVGRSKKISAICCHHEQACAMAAEAYAKLTNSLGVALVTSGPGATNTLTGVLGAYLDSVPCLFISGQAKRQQTVYNSGISGLRQFGVQEINIIAIVKSITKYAVFVNEPDKIRYILEKAIYLAKNGRPGPVWIDIPLDVQAATIDESKLVSFDPSAEIKKELSGKPKISDINKVVSLLRKAKRPVIIAGHGIRLGGAIKILTELVSKQNIPVVSPFLGIDVLATNDKNFIGLIGAKGTRAGNFAVQNSDFILSIGSRLSVSSVGHEYKLFGREAKIIVVDIDKHEHQKKTIKIDKFIHADAKKFLEAISSSLNDKKALEVSWLKKCQVWKNRYPVCLPEYKKPEGPINLYYFVDELSKLLKPSIPVISDAGSSFYAVSQAVKIKKGQRYVTSGGLATMGFGLPAAIGVCRAVADKPVVTITGDGSFQQNIQEIQTIIHYQMPIKIFVINNGGYLSIRQTQKRFFNSNFVGESANSGVSFPKIANIALAYGIKYYKISEGRNLQEVIKRVLSHNGPVICEVLSLPDQEIIPTNSAAIRQDGTMFSKPLEDMYPFLGREEFLENMIIDPVKE